MFSRIHLLARYKSVEYSDKEQDFSWLVKEILSDASAAMRRVNMEKLFVITQNSFISSQYEVLQQFCVQYAQRYSGFTEEFYKFVIIVANISADAAFVVIPALPLLTTFLAQAEFPVVTEYSHGRLVRHVIRLASNLILQQQYSEECLQLYSFVLARIMPQAEHIKLCKVGAFPQASYNFLRQALQIFQMHNVEQFMVGFFHKFYYDSEIADLLLMQADVELYFGHLEKRTSISLGNCWILATILCASESAICPSKRLLCTLIRSRGPDVPDVVVSILYALFNKGATQLFLSSHHIFDFIANEAKQDERAMYMLELLEPSRNKEKSLTRPPC